VLGKRTVVLMVHRMMVTGKGGVYPSEGGKDRGKTGKKGGGGGKKGFSIPARE